LSTAEFAGNVTLAAHGSGWAAAFREAAAGGDEQIGVVLDDGTRFVVGPFAAGPTGDRPALISLDARRLLLVFGWNAAPTSRLSGVVLNADTPQELSMVELEPALAPYDADPTLAQRRPGLARLGSQLFLAWQTESPLGDERSQELFLRELSWSADEPNVLNLNE